MFTHKLVALSYHVHLSNTYYNDNTYYITLK